MPIVYPGFVNITRKNYDQTVKIGTLTMRLPAILKKIKEEPENASFPHTGKLPPEPNARIFMPRDETGMRFCRRVIPEKPGAGSCRRSLFAQKKRRGTWLRASKDLFLTVWERPGENPGPIFSLWRGMRLSRAGRPRRPRCPRRRRGNNIGRFPWRPGRRCIRASPSR